MDEQDNELNGTNGGNGSEEIIPPSEETVPAEAPAVEPAPTEETVTPPADTATTDTAAPVEQQHHERAEGVERE